MKIGTIHSRAILYLHHESFRCNGIRLWVGARRLLNSTIGQSQAVNFFLLVEVNPRGVGGGGGRGCLFIQDPDSPGHISPLPEGAGEEA